MSSSEEQAPLVIPWLGDHDEDDLELFGPYRSLFALVIEGRRFDVPEHTSVLRALQFVEMRQRAVRMPWRDYCWNNTTGCCEMVYREHAGAPERVGRACTTRVKPGMELVRLPKGGRTCRR